MNEKVVVRKIQEGSREALGLLWQESSSNVLNLAFRMLKDRDLAEDILMDVFVSVPKAIMSFREDSTLSTWLYRLTVNACLMKLRADKRHSELESEHWETIVDENLGHSDKSPEYDGELLEKGLATLPADTRSMLWLKDGEGLDVKDLSEIFEMPEGTIKARLSRARKSLQAFLGSV